MKYRIRDHAAHPGPDYWDFRCLICSEDVDEHDWWIMIVLRRLFKK